MLLCVSKFMFWLLRILSALARLSGKEGYSVSSTNLGCRPSSALYLMWGWVRRLVLFVHFFLCTVKTLVVLQRSRAPDRRTYDICLIVCGTPDWICAVKVECSSGAKLLMCLLCSSACSHHRSPPCLAVPLLLLLLLPYRFPQRFQDRLLSLWRTASLKLQPFR